ncbi:MAG TPA: 16S rRNA (guanine(527)-N(7))-methyltransferase RsmG [Stenomitos sp.]
MDAWQLLSQQAAEWGLTVDAPTLDGFRRLYDLLLEGNKRANLTRITDEREAVVKHFLDSVAVLRGLSPEERDRPLRFIDVGTGPGFPGLPLLVMQRHWQGTLLEATRKKVDFMTEAIQALGLNGTALHGRAEEAGQDPARRGAYDLVLARAVAELNVLCELCLPFARPGGTFIAMKGANVDAEVAGAKKALHVLGGSIREIVRFSLPEGFGERALVVIEKVGPTPKAYPRRTGQPSAKPLC